jgi:hypothetical protein
VVATPEPEKVMGERLPISSDRLPEKGSTTAPDGSAARAMSGTAAKNRRAPRMCVPRSEASDIEQQDSFRAAWAHREGARVERRKILAQKG